MCISWLPIWQKAYTLYDLNTHQVFHSRDVIFYENQFPFRDPLYSTSDSHIPLFVDLSSSCDSSFLPSSDILVLSSSSIPSTSSTPSDIIATAPPSFHTDNVASALPFSSILVQSFRPTTTKSITKKYDAYTGLLPHVTKPSSLNAEVSTLPSSSFIDYTSISPSYAIFLLSMNPILTNKLSKIPTGVMQ